MLISGSSAKPSEGGLNLWPHQTWQQRVWQLDKVEQRIRKKTSLPSVSQWSSLVKCECSEWLARKCWVNSLFFFIIKWLTYQRSLVSLNAAISYLCWCRTNIGSPLTFAARSCFPVIDNLSLLHCYFLYSFVMHWNCTETFHLLLLFSYLLSF